MMSLSTQQSMSKEYILYILSNANYVAQLLSNIGKLTVYMKMAFHMSHIQRYAYLEESAKLRYDPAFANVILIEKKMMEIDMMHRQKHAKDAAMITIVSTLQSISNEVNRQRNAETKGGTSSGGATNNTTNNNNNNESRGTKKVVRSNSMLYASQLEEEEAKRREEEAFQKQIQEIEQRELSHYEDYDSDLETLLKEQMPIDTEQQVEEVDQLIAQRAAENNTNTIVVNPAAIIEINKLYEALQQSEPGEQNASEQLGLLRRK
jgi:hypothetical protein